MLFDKIKIKDSTPDDDYGLPEVDMKPVSRREASAASAFEKSKAAPSAIKDAPLAGPQASSTSGKFPLQTEALKHERTTSSEKPSSEKGASKDPSKRSPSKTSVPTIVSSALILALIWVVIFLKSNGIFPFGPQNAEPSSAMNETSQEQIVAEEEPSALLEGEEGWTSTEEEWVEETWEAGGVQNTNPPDEEWESMEELPETIAIPGTENRIETITASTNQFYMIAGSHPTLDAATRDAKTFKAELVYVLFPREGRQENYRIAVGRFAVLEEATDALADFRLNFGESVWVLRY